MAIKIEHVTKQYRLGAIGGGTLKGDLQTWWARMRGKEDPNSKIGSRTDIRIGEKFLALDDINLEVKKGEAIGIIGHNGAGKSTLLKLLSRVTAPTEGKISIDGRIASMLEVGTGFHPELTGRENIYMNGAILGMTRAEIDRKFDEIVEFSEVAKFIDTPVKRYSSGMYVKLAFSVAAHLDSEIMIMDEVLAVGDMAFQRKCLEKMASAARNEGRTVLYVSHNMNTIRQLCTRCIVLDHGRLVFDGNVDEAIAIYMASGLQDDATDINLSGKSMPHIPKKTSVKMEHFRLLEKEAAWYQAGEKVKFDLSIKAYERVSDIRFRFELRNIDGTPVGVALCPSLGELTEGEVCTYSMEFDTSKLAGGKYKCLFVLYAVNEFGSFVDYDAIYPVFSFEIEDLPDIRWNGTSWGRVRFDDLLIGNCVKTPSMK